MARKPAVEAGLARVVLRPPRSAASLSLGSSTAAAATAAAASPSSDRSRTFVPVSLSASASILAAASASAHASASITNRGQSFRHVRELQGCLLELESGVLPEEVLEVAVVGIAILSDIGFETLDLAANNLSNLWLAMSIAMACRRRAAVVVVPDRFLVVVVIDVVLVQYVGRPNIATKRTAGWSTR